MPVGTYLPNDVFKVKERIDPDSSKTTEILLEDQGRTVLFEDLNGKRAAGNVFSTRKKIADALNIGQNELTGGLLNAISSPIDTNVVKKPLFRSKTVNGLMSLPIPKYYPEDGGRYVTAGVIVAESDGIRNVSFHRMMIIDDRRIAVRLVPRHLYTMYGKAKESGKELNVAICIGCRPEVLLAAATSTDYGVDELRIASSMHHASFGRPLDTGMTDNGLIVPADSDYVIEGRLTFEETKEGPFVDITGTYDHVRSQPVIAVDKIWSSGDPVFHLLLPGGNEHYLFMGLPREPMIFRTVRQAVPRTHAVRLTEGGCCWLHGVVSITKNKEGDGMNAIMAAFTGHPSMKHVIVVDEDIDVFSDREVEWAVATRFQGNRMLRVPDAAGSSLDPSSGGTTWKIGIDATRELGKNEKLFRRAEL